MSVHFRVNLGTISRLGIISGAVVTLQVRNSCPPGRQNLVPRGCVRFGLQQGRKTSEPVAVDLKRARALGTRLWLPLPGDMAVRMRKGPFITWSCIV